MNSSTETSSCVVIVLVISMPCDEVIFPSESIIVIFQVIVYFSLLTISLALSLASSKLSACMEPSPPIGKSSDTSPLMSFCSSKLISWYAPILQVSMRPT